MRLKEPAQYASVPRSLPAGIGDGVQLFEKFLARSLGERREDFGLQLDSNAARDFIFLFG